MPDYYNLEGAFTCTINLCYRAESLTNFCLTNTRRYYARLSHALRILTYNEDVGNTLLAKFFT
jgi:hypothetical protein